MLRPTRRAWPPSTLFILTLLLAFAAACGDRTDILLSPEGLDASLTDTGTPFDGHLPDGAKCGPTTCATGCCTALGACVIGTSPDACGTGGATCSECTTTKGCNPESHVCQGAGPCGPTTCSTGCCDTSGACQNGEGLTTCGGGGNACENCTAQGFLSCNAATQSCVGVPVGCDQATCANGCCAPNGTGGLMCVGGESNTVCGGGGGACQDCSAEGETCDASSQSCVMTTTACGPENCGTCCLQGATCVGEPTPPNICGSGGGACTICQPGETCQGNICVGEVEAGGCGPDTCPNGCCALDGTCRAGNRKHACGAGGDECQDCGTNGTCSDGGCELGACGPQTCPAGCCDGIGNCQAGSTLAACGTGGNTCSACPPGDACKAGTCQASTCNAMTCPNGCCDGTGTCQTGNSVNDCGAGGAACSACPAGDACVGAACQGSVCIFSCPNGCCDDNDVCQPGTTNSACGFSESTCAVCSPGAFCEQGTCEDSVCSASTCPTGCCDQNGACQQGNESFECGTVGAACGQCDPTSQCIGGTCVETGCNENTCPDGCCDQNDVCQAGTTNAACGFGGNLCNACPATGFCSDEECVGFQCNAQNCPEGCCDSNDNCQVGFGSGGSTCPCEATCEGCCDAMNNCNAGTVDSACGSNGAVCANCTAQSETCDTFMFPVVCDQSCPSPYAGCQPGTTTTPPEVEPGVCHAFDLTQAAMACADGAETADCQNFFDGEFGSNQNCANCLEQFDIDFIDLSGIYLCAAPFLNAACNVSTGCANDCANTVCEECAGDETACESAAITGECASLVSSANACIAASTQANALCAQASYPPPNSFGNWLAAVGAHYCQQ